jgi:DNA polymerase sigma
MQIKVEITQGKILEVFNSLLLRSYCIVDSRYRQLAIFLKAWNKTLTADKNDRLNSFSICLLLLGFMI